MERTIKNANRSPRQTLQPYDRQGGSSVEIGIILPGKLIGAQVTIRARRPTQFARLIACRLRGAGPQLKDLAVYLGVANCYHPSPARPQDLVANPLHVGIQRRPERY